MTIERLRDIATGHPATRLRNRHSEFVGLIADQYLIASYGTQRKRLSDFELATADDCGERPERFSGANLYY